MILLLNRTTFVMNRRPQRSQWISRIWVSRGLVHTAVMSSSKYPDVLVGTFKLAFLMTGIKCSLRLVLLIKIGILSCQEPITRSMQLPYNRVKAFSQTCLFLDRIFDKFRLSREPRLLITSFANLIIKLSVIKSPWRFCQ